MNRSQLPAFQQRWTILLVVLLVLGAGWTYFSRIPSNSVKTGEQSAPRAGFLAPDFTLDLLNGGQVTLSELRGKVVLVNLWASWCLPCRAEMPAMQKAYEKYKDQGVVILGVNTTFQDGEKNTAEFVQDHDLTFPIALDRDGSVSQRFAMRAVPTSFFIDRDGVIRSVVVGGLANETTILTGIENLLKESP
jgi:cytochrome c biogenesis protein CcmG/thiol:disulfide interchange protein DsbE